MKFNTKLRPLFSDLKNIEIGFYLATSSFERLTVKHKFDEYWGKANNIVEENDTFNSLGHNPKYERSEDALLILLDWYFVENLDIFNKIIYLILIEYIQWIENEIELEYILEDLKNINFSNDLILVLQNLYSTQVTRIQEKKRIESEKKIKKKTGYQIAESIVLKIPKEFIMGIHQYILFFKDYVEIAKEIEIDLKIDRKEKELFIEFNSHNNISKEKIGEWFQEYVSFASTEDSKNISIINVSGNPTKTQIDLLIVKLQNQVSNLKNNLRIANLENQTLKNDKDFLQKLALNFSKKDNIIQNQYIQGGSQQFADKINNKTSDYEN